MPLMKSKSKKAFEHNLKAEMHAGKPQDQSLAIAYSVQRKAKGKKKMAEGGSIFAANEKRPMPNDLHDDKMQARENSGKKAPHNDQWLDKPTEKQAMANDVRGKKLPIKRPKMVPSDAFSTRLYNEEGRLEDSASPGPYDTQPKHYMDEEDAKKSGHPVRDMAPEHSTHRKPYAKGGEVEAKDYEHSMNKYEQSVSHLNPSEDKGEMYADEHDEEGQDRQGPKVPDMEKPHNKEEDKVYGYADGGEIGRSPDDSEDQPHEEAQEEHHNSIAAAIMAHRDRLHKEVDAGSHDLEAAVAYAEGGEVDLHSQHDEEPNNEDQMSFQALKKENYNSSDLDMDQPMDSNEHGDEEEMDSENKHDMIGSIRKKMKAKRQF